MDVESILDERVDQYDLERFREAYETQCRRGSPSAIVTFNYGTALIRSTKQDVIEGVNLLEKLLREEPDDINKRDYVYFLAIANAHGLLGLAVIGGGALVLTGLVAALFSARR
ncbi:hypothetical protein ANCCAN_23718 [Ancylostoma caninum]|uniref:Mitochondrial fission 1 protein n=1 Tax=Ancylostoma caninum TaxID=29170 RepID=A0A368FEN5_ANCCA|nr:hypothetical protein ANCCAN_23718 [Ancylostoma caninum]